MIRKHKIDVTEFQWRLINGLRAKDITMTESEALQIIIQYACENPVFGGYYTSKVGHIGWGYRRGP